MLRVYDQPDLDSFPSGLWGIREPPYEKNDEQRPNGGSPTTLLVSSPLALIPHTPALDPDQQLDLILVPGERDPRVERTSRIDGD